MISNIILTVAVFIGSISAYHQRPTDGTIQLRQTWGQLPNNEALAEYDLLIAVNDCSTIGHNATVEIDGVMYTAIVFDCAGPFGSWWMTTNGVALELSWYDWLEHPEWVGSGRQAIVTIGEQ